MYRYVTDQISLWDINAVTAPIASAPGDGGKGGRSKKGGGGGGDGGLSSVVTDLEVGRCRLNQVDP